MSRYYDFSLVLAAVTPETVDVESRLWVAGCGDATLVFRRGQSLLHFTRRATSFHEVVETATADVHKAGYLVAGLAMRQASQGR